MTRFLRLAAVFGLLAGLAQPAAAQDPGGISTTLLSRCAGKFGAELRAGDDAFPGMTLLGVPWMKIHTVDQTVDGKQATTLLTGLGAQSRRRGQIVPFQFRCLLDAQGAALSFEETDLGPTAMAQQPPGIVIRGTAGYPKTQVPPVPGTELRVQLWDLTNTPPQLLSEGVVRSSWVNPIPYGFRLPVDTKLEGRKLGIEARLVLGSTILYRLKAPLELMPDKLQESIDFAMETVPGGPVR